ncbi:PRC-barrel domain-containing protein [Paracoccus sp. 11-3]|uniref:PRC-barrel domain-containing protein n=1 Tax=Paracoccus amoyensis TaxID=2760093 RepID=A0A926JD19_9RHOB|nr:PRC-barrel domain-containing protein [Paracoccus amoyensis]MBC9247525.1 PRC-barrel domain-containing protein [Paracoccus amoyensis]
MDHSKHVRLLDTDLTEATLNGATVYGPQDEKIGSVSEVIGTGGDAQVVLDVGGFLGIGSKPVQVSARELQFMRDANGDVHAVTSWTKDQLKEMPDYRA